MTNRREFFYLLAIVLLLAALTHQAYVHSARVNAQVEAERSVAALADAARQLEEAATNYSLAADNFRAAAVACLARQRQIWEPLLDQKAFNTTTPAWKLPLGVVEKPAPLTLQK
mgnify:CR=1 FL=1